jgi:hypothetical protein
MIQTIVIPYFSTGDININEMCVFTHRSRAEKYIQEMGFTNYEIEYVMLDTTK